MTTVAVTGGNGFLGRATLAFLADRGYRTVNLSRGDPAHEIADRFLRTDLLDTGEVYGSLAAADADAVVHLGAVPTPRNDPGHVVFESNALGGYHVLEAAAGLGLDRAVLASSLSALGAGFEPDPVDEAHPLSPSTAYGIGKQAMEVAAAGVARRAEGPGAVSLRFPWVVDDETIREKLVAVDRSLAGIRERSDFHTARNTLFTYLHVRDAVEAVEAALTTPVEGHDACYLSAPDTNTETPTADLLDEVYPDADVRADFDEYGALLDTSKAANLLDWAPTRSWRDLAE